MTTINSVRRHEAARMSSLSSRAESTSAKVLTSHGVTAAYANPLPSAPTSDWACAGTDPDVFFPEDEQGLQQARAICGPCPIRAACLASAKARQETGVWGGVLLNQGKILEKVPVRGRPRKVVAA